MSTEPRLAFEAVFDQVPGALEALRSLRRAIEGAGLPLRLLELAYLRASQLNGCAFCVGYHVAEARRLGVSDRLLHLLPVWREVADFAPDERAALAWTEVVTRPDAPHGIPDAAYAEIVAALGEAGATQLTLALGYINAWNRIGAAFRLRAPPF